MLVTSEFGTDTVQLGFFNYRHALGAGEALGLMFNVQTPVVVVVQR